jgi:hypothetical protein
MGPSGCSKSVIALDDKLQREGSGIAMGAVQGNTVPIYTLDNLCLQVRRSRLRRVKVLSRQGTHAIRGKGYYHSGHPQT